MSQKFFKILFLGLDNAGKTSFLLSLENKYSQLHSLRPTKGLYKYEYKILGFSINLLDFGGQKLYREEFFKKPENFLATDLLFYIIDIQDRHRFGENIEFFEKLLAEFEKNDVNPEIIICFHKSDPDVIADKESYVHQNIEMAQKLFKNRSGEREIEFFQTSIYDYSSLIRAYSAGLLKIFKDFTKLIKTIFDDFINKTNANSICLLDQDALILYKYYDEKSKAPDMSEIIGTNIAQMSEKLVSYGFGYPNSIEINLNGWSFFKTFEVDDPITSGKKRFYLIIYTPDSDNFETINQLLPNFTLTILNTLTSFLMEGL